MPKCIRSTELLLLPGMMCDESLWAHQSNALAAECNVSFGALTGSESVAALATALLENAPQRFALAGLSMGGIVAFEMWRQAPQRIERLALLDTNFRSDPAERRNMRNRQIEQVRAGALEEVMREELKPNYLADCHSENQALLDEVLAMGLQLGEAVFVSQSVALRDRTDSTNTLATITCPTLVLCGDEDRLCTPQLHTEMAALIPGATLEVVPQCGHLATMEQPKAVNDALGRWLSS